MSRRERRTFWACFSGWALDAMDVQLYAVVMPTLISVWALSRSDAGLLATSALVTSSAGGWLAGMLADRIGRVKVLQLTSPESQRGFYGFSPAPMPELIAWAKTPSPAVAMSKGLDRDRAVDETGGQIAVFGRLGSRPFTRAEMERLFLTRSGVPWKVSDEVDMASWVPGSGPAVASRD